MPVTKGSYKEALISTRVTERIGRIIDKIAEEEGLTVSEWIRNLIIRELKARGDL